MWDNGVSGWASAAMACLLLGTGLGLADTPGLVFSKTFGGSGADTVTAIATDPSGAVILAGNTTSFDFPVTNNSHNPATDLSSSVDGGLTWQSLSRLPSGWATALAIDPADPQVWYAGGSTGIFQSTDAGTTWQPLNVPLPPCNYVPPQCGITGLVIADGHSLTLTRERRMWREGTPGPVRTLYAATVAGVLKSTDSGRTWQVSSPLPNQGKKPTTAFIDYLVGDPFHADHIFTAAHGVNFDSFDGGNTWSSYLPPAGSGGVTSGPTNRVAFDPFRPGLVYTVYYGKVSRSTDAGRSWQSIATPFLASSAIFADPTTPGVVYVLAGIQNTAIYRTSDGGVTWSSSLTSTVTGEYLAVDPANSSVVLTSSLRTGDGGVTWSSLPLGGPAGQIVFDPGNPGRAIAVSSFNAVVGTGFLTKLDAGGQILFSTYFGGFGATISGAVADASGNIYVAGIASSSSFPATAGAYQTDPPPSGQAPFVAKFGPAGNLVFASYMNSSRNPYNPSLAVDSKGSIVISGTVSAATAIGCEVEKLAPDGGALVFSTAFGTSSTMCSAAAEDAAGNTIVGGTAGPDLAATANMASRFGGGTEDGVLAKFDPQGNLIHASYLGGSGRDLVNALAVDASGNIYVAGTTASADFPVTGGAYQTGLSAICPYPTAIDETGLVGTLTFYGDDDIFVAKLNSSGAIVYATYLGGLCMNLPSGMAVDTSGNVWITGTSDSDAFPQVNPFEPAPTDEFYQGVVAGLDSKGAALRLSSWIGAGQTPVVSVDSKGNAYVGGSTMPPRSPDSGPPGPTVLTGWKVALFKLGG